MADDDLKKEESEEPQKIKVGESEFTAEELEGLVGKARQVSDFEEKQGQSFDEVVKSWGKRGEVIGAFKKAVGYESPEDYLKAQEEAKKEAERKQVEEKQTAGKELTPEEQAKLVREELGKHLKEMGYVSREEAQGLFRELREGEKILFQVNRIARRAEKEGLPKVEPEQLLEFMADPANPKDPEKAYKLMFEKELEEAKEKKLASMKRQEIVTEEGGSAGAKQPTERVPQTPDELKQSLLEHLTASE